ncbi:ABC transporter ATP-binding protein [Ktedonobacteria bacterium brp13]|nr:ABC transporter ATP-binding protein [Ktedonobacteria bacterium brp13]
MLLTVRALSKGFSVHRILENVTFTINANDRAGIVGPNGVGKTTLLRLLVGQEEVDSGSISYAPATEYGYLSQTTPPFYGRSIDDMLLAAVGNLKRLEERMRELEQAMAITEGEPLALLMQEYGTVSSRYQDRGGYELDYKIDMILSGLRIDYLPRQQRVETLSGGEKARVGLAALLLQSPDILLLDEPTNHLDVASMEWLEEYIAQYAGAVLMVSHDRQFLNKAVNQIFEITEHDHQLKQYSGNYDAYVATREIERRHWLEQYERQQEEIKELKKRIKVSGRQVGHTHRAARDNDKFLPYFFEQNVQSTIAKNVRAAQVQLERIEADALEKPPEAMQVNSQFQGSGIQSQVVIHLDQLCKRFGERTVLNDVNASIAAQDRIILTGPNGSGKTTLLKLIMGQEQPGSGSVTVVAGARIGYLPQEPDDLDLGKTVIETYRREQIGYEGEHIGKLIGYGLFRREDMEKQVRQLSIGQRRKLEIACLMAQQPNVLLLDEPTNYISLEMLEAFESAIMNFAGPVIVITHDRWFIRRLHDHKSQRWELTDGQLQIREEEEF